jgi:hypothetical protein
VLAVARYGTLLFTAIGELHRLGLATFLVGVLLLLRLWWAFSFAKAGVPKVDLVVEEARLP